eukprot:403359513
MSAYNQEEGGTTNGVIISNYPDTPATTTISQAHALPYLGDCHKSKGAQSSDCKKGMVINRTLRTGDKLIKLRDSLDLPTDTENTIQNGDQTITNNTNIIKTIVADKLKNNNNLHPAFGVFNDQSIIAQNQEQQVVQEPVVVFRNNNFMTIIVITSLVLVASFLFLVLAYYSNFLYKNVKGGKSNSRNGKAKNQQKPKDYKSINSKDQELKLNYSSSSDESVFHGNNNLPVGNQYYPYQQLSSANNKTSTENQAKSFFENISENTSLISNNDYQNQSLMYFMRPSHIPQLLQEDRDDVPKFKKPSPQQKSSSTSSNSGQQPQSISKSLLSQNTSMRSSIKKEDLSLIMRNSKELDFNEGSAGSDLDQEINLKYDASSDDQNEDDSLLL